MANFFKKLGSFVKDFGLIGAAASLIGGNQSRKDAAASAKQQYLQQKEFAQHGIRWRVEDAKAAGLHPLYALGGQVPSYSPVSVQDSMGPAIADAGQSVQRAIAATSTPMEKQLHALTMRKLQSEIDETDARAGYYRSETARNAQSQTPGLPHESQHLSEMGTTQPTGRTTPPVDSTVITAVPGDSATADGATPLWRPFTLANGLPIVLPGGISGDAAEVLESLSESYPMMIMVYKENVRRYGQKWGDEFLKRYMPYGEHVVDYLRGEPPARRIFKKFVPGFPKVKKSVPFIPYEGY